LRGVRSPQPAFRNLLPPVLPFAAMAKVRFVITIVAAAYLLLLLGDRFVLVELFFERDGAAIALAVLEAAAIVGAGWLARRARESDPILDFVIGYPIFGAVCFLIGLLRVSVATMTTVVVIFAFAGAWSMIRKRAEWSMPNATPGSAAVLGLIAVAGFIAAQTPPSSLDELAYHLAIPHAWVTAGRAIDLPLISHSYFPLGIESADLVPLALLDPLRGGIASHFLHLVSAIATTLLIFRTTRSLFVTAAIAATPALAITAGWSLVDWPLLGVCVALYAAIEADDAAALGASIAAGLLTKYTFVPFAILLLIGARRWRGVWPGLVAGSLFFIRNLVLTGNPIAPFLSATAPHVAGYRTPFLSDYVFEGHFIDEVLGVSIVILCVMMTGRVALPVIAGAIGLFFLAPSSRILLPFLAIPAMTAGPRVKRTMAVLIGLAIAMQLALLGFSTERSEAMTLLDGVATDEQYLTKVRPSYAAVSWLNAVLPPRSRTLVVGLNETYWFTHDVRGGGNFDGPRVSAYLSEPTPEALYAKLRREGITHVAVIANPPATTVQQKIAERETQLSPAARRTLAETLNGFVSNVTARGSATLFTLR